MTPAAAAGGLALSAAGTLHAEAGVLLAFSKAGNGLPGGNQGGSSGKGGSGSSDPASKWALAAGAEEPE